MHLVIIQVSLSLLGTTPNKRLFGMPGGCEADNDKGDEIDKSDAIPTTCQRRRATTEIERFHLGTSDVDGYEGADGDDADADEEKESSQANDGFTQTLED
jgi:hypothetical protein